MTHPDTRVTWDRIGACVSSRVLYFIGLFIGIHRYARNFLLVDRYFPQYDWWASKHHLWHVIYNTIIFCLGLHLCHGCTSVANFIIIQNPQFVATHVGPSFYIKARTTESSSIDVHPDTKWKYGILPAGFHYLRDKGRCEGVSKQDRYRV